MDEQKLIKWIQNLQDSFQKAADETNDNSYIYTSKDYYQIISDTYKDVLSELNKKDSFLRN